MHKEEESQPDLERAEDAISPAAVRLSTKISKRAPAETKHSLITLGQHTQTHSHDADADVEEYNENPASTTHRNVSQILRPTLQPVWAKFENAQKKHKPDEPETVTLHAETFKAAVAYVAKSKKQKFWLRRGFWAGIAALVLTMIVVGIMTNVIVDKYKTIDSSHNHLIDRASGQTLETAKVQSFALLEDIVCMSQEQLDGIDRLRFTTTDSESLSLQVTGTSIKPRPDSVQVTLQFQTHDQYLAFNSNEQHATYVNGDTTQRVELENGYKCYENDNDMSIFYESEAGVEEAHHRRRRSLASTSAFAYHYHFLEFQADLFNKGRNHGLRVQQLCSNGDRDDETNEIFPDCGGRCPTPCPPCRMGQFARNKYKRYKNTCSFYTKNCYIAKLNSWRDCQELCQNKKNKNTYPFWDYQVETLENEKFQYAKEHDIGRGTCRLRKRHEDNADGKNMQEQDNRLWYNSKGFSYGGAANCVPYPSDTCIDFGDNFFKNTCTDCREKNKVTYSITEGDSPADTYTCNCDKCGDFTANMGNNYELSVGKPYFCQGSLRDGLLEERVDADFLTTCIGPSMPSCMDSGGRCESCRAEGKDGDTRTQYKNCVLLSFDASPNWQMSCDCRGCSGMAGQEGCGDN